MPCCTLPRSCRFQGCSGFDGQHCAQKFGHALGHSLVQNATRKGLGKLVLNEDKLAADLEQNWAIAAEAIQTILRREDPEPYEALKALTPRMAASRLRSWRTSSKG